MARPFHLCVFCASSKHVDEAYFAATRQLGGLLAQNGVTLVYGGGRVGLMGALAMSVHAAGGRVIGVIPESMMDKEVAYTESDELIVTATMRERKAVMEQQSDAFVALPGGFGTLEEVLEILTLRMLRYHEKPVGFLNTGGFYDGLLALFEGLYRDKFAKEKCRELYYVAQNPGQVLAHLGAGRPAR